MSKQPNGEQFHHSGVLLDRPASLTIMAIRSTDATVKEPDQAPASEIVLVGVASNPGVEVSSRWSTAPCVTV